MLHSGDLCGFIFHPLYCLPRTNFFSHLLKNKNIKKRTAIYIIGPVYVFNDMSVQVAEKKQEYKTCS